MPDGGAEGVLAAHGGRFGGYALYVQDGRLRYHYNLYGIERTEVVSSDELPAGVHRLGMRFETPGGPGAPATVSLFVDDEAVGKGDIERITLHTYTLMGDNFCVGYDDATPVSDSYTAPFRFTGELRTVTVAAEGDAPDVSEQDWEASLRSQ